MSFCSAVRDENDRIIAYAVLDVNKPEIAARAEEESSGFFSQLFIVNPESNLLCDLNHSENDGNFSSHPLLTRVQAELPGIFTEDERLVVYHPLAVEPFVIAGIVPLNVVLSNLSYLLKITLWFLVFSIFIAVGLSFIVSRAISYPVHKLTLAMGEVEAGNLAVRIPERREDEVGVLFRRFNMMTGRIEELMKETMEEQTQLRIAERKALQAQINPHFMYNTLNTVKSIARLRGVDEITTIVTRFGRILRDSIENDRELVSLRESLELVESYLEIQKIRYGERLSYRIDIPESFLNLLIPKLILQPLVENAVVHGLEKKIDPGSVEISAEGSEGCIVIRVCDDGAGFSGEPFKVKDTSGNGVGLYNVHRRLELLYGKPFGLDIRSIPGEGTEVFVRIPEQRSGDDG